MEAIRIYLFYMLSGFVLIYGRRSPSDSPNSQSGARTILVTNGNATCAGLCGVSFDFDSVCFCDINCLSFNDCCSDFGAVCGATCVGGCQRRTLFCECDDMCETFHDCCPDRKQHCDSIPFPGQLEEKSCGRGFHQVETDVGSVDLNFLQMFLRPGADEKEARKTLKDSGNMATLTPNQCLSIIPESVMSLELLCMRTRLASAISVFIPHEAGVYENTKSMSFASFWRRICFRFAESLNNVAEVEICFQSETTAIELMDVEAKFCHNDELTLRNFSE